MSVSDHVWGETLDVILDLLDEETLDGLFNDDITTTVEELTSSVRINLANLIARIARKSTKRKVA